MARISIALLGGIVAGAAATYYWVVERAAPPDVVAATDERDSTRDSPNVAPADAPNVATRAPSNVADRAAFYTRVATADRATVEALLRNAAVRPTDSENRFVIDAALRRYVEIDPDRALSLARELNRAGHTFIFLGSLYDGWAHIDRDAALAAVGRVDDPVESRAAALAVMRAFGDEPGAVERVAAIVRGVDANAFRVDAIAVRAESSPLAALEEALAFSDAATRKSAAERALMSAAWSSPRDATAIVDAIDDPDLKSALQTTLLKNWSANDAEGMLAYQKRVSPAARSESQGTAASQIARTDPERAIELIEQMLPGQERQRLLTSVAREYAKKDPEKALAWAKDLRPPQPEVVGAVFDTLALSDPLRAFDLAVAIESPASRTRALQSVAEHGGSNASQSAALADRALVLDDDQAKDVMLETIIQGWSVSSVNQAAEWLVANADRVSLRTMVTMGQRFGQRDPDATARYLDRVPSAARGAWIGAVAQAYARSNPQRATSFLAGFRSDPAYPSAAARLAIEIARTDPATAAQMLDGLEIETPSPGTRPTQQQMDVQGATMMTAQHWARTDPPAAAAWALGLRGDMARTGPLFSVSQVWASTDPRGARDWILRLPAGGDRDTALRGFIGSTPDPSNLDTVLMNAFSTAEMRQRTLSGYAGLFARKDPQVARRLIAEYVTDPTMREAAERQIEFALNRPSPPPGLMPADPTLPTPAGRSFEPTPGTRVQ